MSNWKYICGFMNAFLPISVSIQRKNISETKKKIIFSRVLLVSNQSLIVACFDYWELLSCSKSCNTNSEPHNLFLDLYVRFTVIMP